ncbi:MAG: amidohydrolase [Lachnospiraceae bacterium]|nr:amidohydrolase [Lachnospiraceae bacterium]
MKEYDLVIENAAILTMDAAGTFIENGIIGVTDGTISLLDKQTADLRCPAKERIDAKGMLALPGFVNTHVHCFQSLLKGLGADLPLIGWLNSSVQPFGVRVSHRQQELATLVACLEAIKSGCTTLSEFFYTNQDPELADVCIETMQKTGIRSVFMRTFQDYGEEYNVPACYLEPVEKAIEEVERLRKIPHSDDMLSIWTGPDVTWATTKKGYEAILEYCLDRKVRYTMHLNETAEDNDMCRRHYGKSIVDLLDDIGFLTEQFLAVHCVYLTQEEIKLFAEKGVSVSHNPAANLYLGSGIAPIPECLQAGINVSLGTDGAASNNTTDMLDTMRLAALIHKGACRDATAMSAEKVVRMATAGGAKALGMENMIGTLETGKKADIVLFDPARIRSIPMYDPMATLVYSASAENINTTIVNGKVVYRGGVFSCGIDEAQLYREVMSEMAKSGLPGARSEQAQRSRFGGETS